MSRVLIRSPSFAVLGIVLSAVLLFPIPASSQDEPELPKGLEPVLEEPPLPEGLGMDRTQEQAKEVVEENLLFDLSGFIDARSGRRTRHDPNESDFALGEIRARIEAEKTLNDALARLSFDLLYDAVATDHDVDLETGEGWLDLREAFVTTRAAGFLDLKIGRQILTWGTGDLIFINDLFPKDFVSFFIGRHREYLKAPSDSFKASFFSRFLNLDFVYTPRFDPDRIIDGSRISFFSPTSGQLTGRRSVVSVDRPDQWFRDDEIAVRLYRNLGALEVAGYLYRGFWKSPAGNDPARGQSIFPRLTVAGASARGPLMGGIANAEFGFYRSEDDTRGSDPMVRNSELRFLIGFERELWRDLTLGAQYYLERINDYSNYQRSLPAGAPRSDENRHLLTARVTQQLLQQNLELGLFAYWVPSDHDAYLRPRIHYKIDDHWSAEMGGHIFLGRRSHTFFGQFKRNSSLYLAVRFGF